MISPRPADDLTRSGGRQTHRNACPTTQARGCLRTAHRGRRLTPGSIERSAPDLDRKKPSLPARRRRPQQPTQASPISRSGQRRPAGSPGRCDRLTMHGTCGGGRVGRNFHSARRSGYPQYERAHANGGPAAARKQRAGGTPRDSSFPFFKLHGPPSSALIGRRTAWVEAGLRREGVRVVSVKIFGRAVAVYPRI